MRHTLNEEATQHLDVMLLVLPGSRSLRDGAITIAKGKSCVPRTSFAALLVAIVYAREAIYHMLCHPWEPFFVWWIC